MILVTGHAGFIGFHLTRRLLALGHEVAGLDNLSDYYDVSLKKDRLSRLEGLRADYRVDLSDAEAVRDVFERTRPEVVFHLAAQAGVRHSISHPQDHVRSNVSGTLNVLEGCRAQNTQQLLFASSSSVYGAHDATPFRTEDETDRPLSPYAASKKSAELMAHVYAHLYGLKVTGLRFFTVYGPWGRPDMAPHLFASAIRNGRTLSLFNAGEMMRDFTYVDDVVESMARLMERPPAEAFRLFNVGRGEPVGLLDFVRVLEKELGRQAKIHCTGMQAGDVRDTWADVGELVAATGFSPVTPLADGIRSFVRWHVAYYS